MDYTISYMAAVAYAMRTYGDCDIDLKGFSCPDGDVNVVAHDGQGATVLIVAKAKRQRGEAKPIEANMRRLAHIAMWYVAQHVGVDAVKVDVVEALIGKNATVSISALDGAYSWER
jgi:hypothetical protein